MKVVVRKHAGKNDNASFGATTSLEAALSDETVRSLRMTSALTRFAKELARQYVLPARHESKYPYNEVQPEIVAVELTAITFNFRTRTPQAKKER